MMQATEVTTCMPIQVMSFSARALHIPARQLNHTLHVLQQHDFAVEESRCWTSLSAVHTVNQLKPFGSITEHKIWQRRPRTVEQVESYNRQE